MCALLAFLLSFGNKLLSFSNLFLPIHDNSLQKWDFIRNFVPSFALGAPAKGLSSHLKTHKSHHHNLINTHTLLDKYKRKLNGIDVVPTLDFLKNLWDGKVI